MIGYGRGGGGGFGGFPYRSSHQQGQDGRRRGGRGRGRGGRHQRSKQSRTQSSSQVFDVELHIPPDHRRVIVGRGGTALKWLKEVSGANIFVPHVQRNNRRGRSTQQETDNINANADLDGTSSQEQVNQHPVRVKSSELPSILHAFELISSLLSTTSDMDADFVPCIVKMRTNDISTLVDGKLFIQRVVGNISSKGDRCLFSGTIRSGSDTDELQAYCVEASASFDEESVSMIVDNILFVDSSLERCHWYYKETPIRNNTTSTNNHGDEDDKNAQRVRRTVLLFGSSRDNSKLFFDTLKDEISSAENNA